MKRILTILLLILIAKACFTQSLFNKNYPLEWQYDCHSMKSINDNYYICGHVARQSEPCIYWLMGYHISKINSVGEFNNIKYFDKCEQGTYTGGFNETMFAENDTLIIAGNIFTDSLTISYILLLDENLDSLSAFNAYSDTLTRRVHSIIKKNNSLILCGGVDSSYNSINNPTPSVTYSKSLLFEVALDGTINWSKSYRFDTDGNNCWSVIHNVCKTTDNGYIAIGATNDIGLPRRNLVMKTDSVGNKKWVRFFGNSIYSNPLFTDIIPTHDSCFIVCGAYTYGETFGGLYPYDGWLIKIDNDGNTKWEKKHRDYVYGSPDYRDTIYSIYYAIAERPNGDLVAVCGTRSDDEHNYIGKRFRIRFLDSLGNIQWDKVITSVGEQEGPLYPTSIILTEDNGIAIGGWAEIYYYDEENNWVSDQRIFLIKTDSLGNDTLISDISPVQSKPIAEFKLECYPNPASSEFFIDLPQGVDYDMLEIYSTNGSLVHEQRAQNGINTVNNCNLQPGVYLLRLRDKKIFGKIIIE